MIYFTDFLFYLLLILDVEIEKVKYEEMDCKEKDIHENITIKEECITHQYENEGKNFTGT